MRGVDEENVDEKEHTHAAKRESSECVVLSMKMYLDKKGKY